MIDTKGALRRLFLFLLVLQALPSLAAGTPACPATAYDETAQVSKVHDGDTVWLDDGRKIRLIGINAPELARDGKPAEALASPARDHLRERLQQSDNRVRLVYGMQRLDRYQRTLAHLFLPDGLNLQAELIAHGLATASTYPPNTAFSSCYHQVEQGARCRRQGIWSEPRSPQQQSSQLAADASGFHWLSGRVERVSESGKGMWIFLEGGVMIGVRPAELGYFDKAGLFSLQGQHIQVRGWLHPKPGNRKGVKFYMRIRHPSAIESLTGTDNIPKC